MPCAYSNHHVTIDEMYKYLVLSLSQSSLCALKHVNVSNRCDNIVWSGRLNALKKTAEWHYTDGVLVDIQLMVLHVKICKMLSELISVL